MKTTYRVKQRPDIEISVSAVSDPPFMKGNPRTGFVCMSKASIGVQFLASGYGFGYSKHVAYGKAEQEALLRSLRRLGCFNKGGIYPESTLGMAAASSRDLAERKAFSEYTEGFMSHDDLRPSTGVARRRARTTGAYLEFFEQEKRGLSLALCKLSSLSVVLPIVSGTAAHLSPAKAKAAAYQEAVMTEIVMRGMIERGEIIPDQKPKSNREFEELGSYVTLCCQSKYGSTFISRYC
ncbi:hypothetical protein [uncultured Roseobacter sp.]|uniref:hypothetical protein n=1 Tax=uncultured Roseobacter sp. TaxID=114847 RepID=UPI00262D779F|nr:hypothetical protein [uncultured Roseobacter sp.]